MQSITKTKNDVKQTTVETLNDLIRINLDRVDGYQKAIEKLDDGSGDLKTMFNNLLVQAKKPY